MCSTGRWQFIEARSVMYANQMGESQRLQAQDLRAEKAAIDVGFFEVDDMGNPVTEPGKTYPKRMDHPGYPAGAAHGLLIKDYRGKDGVKRGQRSHPRTSPRAR